MIFVLHGALCMTPSLAVFMHLEALGYAIWQINVLDSFINVAWGALPLMQDAPLGVVQWLGAGLWLCLALSPPAELWMLLSESAVAAHQAALERAGIGPAGMRAKLVGTALGVWLGNVLLSLTSYRAVYVFEALLFLASFTRPRPPPAVETEAAEAEPLERHFVIFNTLQYALPDPGAVLFFYCTDMLGMTPADFGWIYASSVLAQIAGTAVEFSHSASLAVLCQIGYGMALLLMLTRWVLGYDFYLILIPNTLASFAGSILATQFQVGAGAAVSFQNSLNIAARGVGLALSTALMAGLGVNHNEYANLFLLVYLCVLPTILMLPYAVYVDRCSTVAA